MAGKPPYFRNGAKWVNGDVIILVKETFFTAYELQLQIVLAVGLTQLSTNLLNESIPIKLSS